MVYTLKICVLFLSLLLIDCQSDNTDIKSVAPSQNPKPTQLTLATKSEPIKYLALGDSYTIGQSVCETCRFPEQLKAKLYNLNTRNSISLNIIAKTGWTTSNLISAINSQNPSNDYDLVTLLIGVNNQYQGNSFSEYEKEFPDLVNKAILLAKGDKTNLIVVSIPDYAYTPFGNGNKRVSTEIDQYNSYAQNYCAENSIIFVNITDITRQGLSNPSLVASDNLHPSEKAYTLFVERILPKAVDVLQN
ncbi:lysophospholipase L1-like esterase [Flavobacterium sp. 103]|uniref:SGNH/GDSL hydrolase family protein n=1 Tax=unclassified Flavobacterium TaxID=196869 RepID=UPI000D5CD30D|nr:MULTISPECIES: SGNH/GDSL hydrolase family protein [unclassified Flavobacterium]PVX46201.1 lysophospholipase L1-like esterase [Flavobacterium sp. 103]QKJ61687.1 SGNH/GDSL hydrolase family protein [Flavobacterium sp. M31R6]